MIATTATINQADILGRALELRRSELSPEVAQFLLAIELSPEDRQHLDLLADRARRIAGAGRNRSGRISPGRTTG